MRKAKVFKDADNQWRWHIKAENGEIVAEGGEGYHNQKDAIDGLEAVIAQDSVDTTVEGEQ